MKSLVRGVFLIIAMLLGLIADQLNAEPFFFVTNPNDVTVTTIDGATGQSLVIMDAGDGLTRPSELTIDRFGNVYVANVSSPNILRLSTDGQITVFVSGLGIINEVHGLAFGPQGDLFIADGTRIYRSDTTNGSLTLFGDVTSANQAFNIVEDIEIDRTGKVYAASGENVAGRGAIVKFDSLGNASVLASGLDNPRDLAVDDLGHLYVANRVGETVNRLELSTGSIELFADLSQASGDPRGVKTDLENNVYVLNSNGDIRKWNSDGIGGNVEFRSGSSFSEALAFFSQATPALVVSIDVRPENKANKINLKHTKRISVAILSDDDFDPSTIDVNTVRFGATGSEAAPVHVAQKQVNRDRVRDLLLRFELDETGIKCGHTSAAISGQVSGGESFTGSAPITTTGCEADL